MLESSDHGKIGGALMLKSPDHANSGGVLMLDSSDHAIIGSVRKSSRSAHRYIPGDHVPVGRARGLGRPRGDMCRSALAVDAGGAPVARVSALGEDRLTGASCASADRSHESEQTCWHK